MNLKKKKTMCFELDLCGKKKKKNDSRQSPASGTLAHLQGSSGELGFSMCRKKASHFSKLDFLVCFALQIRI